jgi:hypothetical protein
LKEWLVKLPEVENSDFYTYLRKSLLEDTQRGIESESLDESDTAKS